MHKHYKSAYFSWQKKAGEYGASQDLWMYEPFVKKNYSVLDFGCGGGYMLTKLKCRQKYGIDINSAAREETKKNGITVFEKFENIPRAVKFDLIMSHHVLEHLENPAKTLYEFKKYLKKNGLLVLVVPIDDWRIEKEFVNDDVNQHFYTWTPLLIGNLFKHCGYKIQKIEIINASWLPLSRFYYRYIPKFIYMLFSRLWSEIVFSRQIRIIAKI